MIANLKRNPSHKLVANALTVLERMEHRGGAGSEANTGDGAGLLCSIPDLLYRETMAEQGVTLPPAGEYGTGMVFFTKQDSSRNQCKSLFEEHVANRGLKLLGWRKVPTDQKKSDIGPSALACEPVALMPFIVKGAESKNSLETDLMLLRRCFEREAVGVDPDCYVCSLSTRTIVYKGMVTAEQLRDYYVDLTDERMQCFLSLVHSRFSTNTFPSWARAQPLRMMCHNGEINTLRGNLNWMRAREPLMFSKKLGDKGTKELRPICDETQSDSGCLDNALEAVFHGSDRTLPESILMMIPEPWEKDPTIDPAQRDFYRYHSNLMEPWDGPALVAFTDGRVIGATLDRNGLRPSRFYVTSNDEVVLASEVGCLADALDVGTVVERGRLVPGQIFLVDLEKGCIIRNADVKNALASSRPYSDWCKNMVTMDEVRERATELPLEPEIPALNRVLASHGFTQEALELILVPMANTGKEPLGSMGNDAPLAVLSLKPRVLYEYFKQLFAQVTNPPVDPIREASVMSLSCPIGPAANMLESSGVQAQRLDLDQPILSPTDMAALQQIDYKGLKCKTIDMTVPYQDAEGIVLNGGSILQAVERIAREAEAAVREGYAFVCLSDIAVSRDRVAIGSLLAVGGVHHHLLAQGLRMRVGILVQSGDSRDVHHWSLLFGYGADAVEPHMVYRLLKQQRDDGVIDPKMTDDELVTKVQKAFDYGFRKVMAKMGICTLQSYKGAQIFEAVGVGKSVIDKAFVGTASRIGGIDWNHIAIDALRFHNAGFPRATAALDAGVAWHTQSARIQYARTGIFDGEENGEKFALPAAGDMHFRDGGESHYNDAAQMTFLQQAARTNSREAYKLYKEMSHRLVRETCLRGQLEVVEAARPLHLSDVEPASEIVKRFTTGAMSLGSISSESHETLAQAMNNLGGKSNTGEGGEDPKRFSTNARSAIKQVASARFGVTSNYLTNADQIQIKMAQGAKPGEGGELPGSKVTFEIAERRNSTPGVGLISPPPHHDIYSIEDLAQLIHDLKNANPSARISVKLVSEVGVGVVAAGVAKAKADHILISGHDGGTGAAMWSGIKATGLPWELGLAEAQQTLVLNDLRGRVILETDGQMKTGFDATVAFMLGAEEVGFSTAPLIALGCIMMRKCHLNTCPVGIATQDPVLRAKFKGQPEHVMNFLWMVAEEVREYMAMMGFATVAEMVGRSDKLRINEDARNWKTKGLDLSRVLLPSQHMRAKAALSNNMTQNHGLEHALDNKILKLVQRTIDGGPPSEVEVPIVNINRSVGAMLSHEVSKKYGEAGLPDGSIKVKLMGSAGQSVGAFLARGVEFEVEGEVNDGAGKSLSGGVLTAYPSHALTSSGSYVSESNVICGNAALYGAVTGKAFFRGKAGERFAVRNSGAVAVVEGVGDHGLEYMTGGRCVILGPVGRNFSAGMSGGIAWVYDPDRELAAKTNAEEPLRELTDVSDNYTSELRGYIEEHLQRTDSAVAKSMLDNWEETLPQFVQVMPVDYKIALENLAAAAAASSSSGTAPAANKASARMYSTTTAPASSKVSQPIAAPRAAKPSQSSPFGATRRGFASEPPKNPLRAFVDLERKAEPYRPPADRLKDFGEIYKPVKEHAAERKKQAQRCMDCGTPYCNTNTGCPINNLIPEWNRLVHNDDYRRALDRLLRTNPFPEFTGRVCPAPCEGACIAGLVAEPVTIKNIEYAIADWGWQSGAIRPRPPKTRTNIRVAVIGSGPAGLAAADELNRMGHSVTVLERAPRAGGLLMYGIPNMKLDKRVVQRRLDLMAAEGVEFQLGVSVGEPGSSLTLQNLRDEYHAVLIATGATAPRPLPIKGHELNGIHDAMEFLTKTQQTLFDHNPRTFQTEGKLASAPGVEDWAVHDWTDPKLLSAKDKDVIVIGGGDTGTDCVATAIRHGARSVTNLELMPRPPNERGSNNPWPEWPKIFRVDYGHAEAAEKQGADPRKFCVMSKEFLSDGKGNVAGLKIASLVFSKDENGRPKITEVPDTVEEIKGQLVLLALGFLGPEEQLVEGSGLELSPNSTFLARHGTGGKGYRTTLEGVFTAGDCRRGQSLVVWAINEGRNAAVAIDRFVSPQ